MSSYRLQVVGAGTEVPISLKGNEWIVGRSADSDIHLADALVSRRHGLLYLDSDELFVRDLGSTNPVEVNGAPIEGPRRLEVGDVLLFGNTQVRVDAARQVRVRLVADEEVSLEQDTVAYADLPRGDDKAAGERAGLLGSLADALVPVRSPEDAAALTLDLLWRLFPCARAVVARTARSDRLHALACRATNDEARFEIPRSLVAALRREKSPLCLRHPHAQNGDDAGLVAFAAPLLARGSVTGILYLEKDAGADPCSRGDLELVLCIARILADRLALLEQLERLSGEIEGLRAGAIGVPRFLGASQVIRALRDAGERLATSDCALAILGEPGSGRETLARHVHGARKAQWAGQLRPFVSFEARTHPGVDPAEELFGRAEAEGGLLDGKLAAAHEGSLCLRNADSIPSDVQKRLVALLGGAEVETSAGAQRIRVRLAVTSELDPASLEHCLVPELRALLGKVRLRVPPLREHLEDLPLLAADTLAEQALHSGFGPAILSPRAMDRLLAHEWRGNIAELRRVLKPAAILARGRTIYPKQLALDPPGTTNEERAEGAIPTLSELERSHIRKVLETYGGNRKLSAKALGIAESTLYDRLRKHGLGKENGPRA